MNKTLILFLFLLSGCMCAVTGQNISQVRGWNILSDSRADDIVTINAACSYNINHLQLSHDLVMDLRELRDTSRCALVKDLIKKAHDAGINEVVIWDHALYDLRYYPEKFRTGPEGTINLDDPEFHEWLKQDYRQMMALVPEADGIVLTFIETGARAENQYSEKLTSPSEKLAFIVDAVADVICGELGKRLFIRTFAYTANEYRNLIECIGLINNRNIILMMKETPHDFFLTHPNDSYAGSIDRPTIIEFDCGNEFNGQGIIANTWPEYILRRASDLLKRPNVIGYVARTDRYRDTRVVGTPNEINLYALKRFTEAGITDAGKIYKEFISAEYGKKSLPFLKPAFSRAFEIVSSSLYTLGTNVANHSKLDYDPYKSSYARHVSGKWIDPPVVYVGHNVNRKFHYWKDVIEHIAPARYKLPDEAISTEAPWVMEKGWVTPAEKMNEEYLRYIIAEKNYSTKNARRAYELVLKAEKVLDPDDFNQIKNLFYRTLLTAEIYEAVATAYYGFRIWARGEDFHTDWLKNTINNALKDMLIVAGEIDAYREKVPRGQWNWRGDAATAREYFEKIAVKGWKEYNYTVFKQF
ncbi:MAG: hypothetical protein GYA43_11690 [Bacteroidales bacterium]|nr:hypothetical protein [Bacteroidales bacterium]